MTKQVDSGSPTQPFDPFASIFVAQPHRPEHLLDINPRTLAPHKRTLLVIDGTVTRFLESYMMEPIDIVNLGQTKETLKQYHQWLDLEAGRSVVSRRVLLRGKHTQRVYASAASLVVPERVKQAVKRAVGEISEGIGRMLLNGKIEQYRELLWYGKERRSDLPEELRSLSCEYCLARTYRIIVGGSPAMMITEWFELESEQSEFNRN